MSKYIYIYMIVVLAFLSLGCSQPVQNNSEIVLPSTVAPLTVSVASGSPAEVTSLQARVKRFQGDSRVSGDLNLSEEYSLAIRIIDGKIHTRMDKPASVYNQMKPRSIFNDGDFVTMVSEGQVLSRTPVPDQMSQAARTAPMLTKGLFQRMPIGEMKSQFRRLNFRSEPGKKAGQDVFFFPKEQLNQLFPGKNTLSYSITVDENVGLVVNTEIQMAVDGDETLIIKNTPLFTLVDGVPILVGQVNEETHDYKTLIDTSDNILPPVEPESVPTLSPEELDALISQGADVRDIPAPEDTETRGVKDYTLTEVEVYESVDLNAAPESLFRIPVGGF